MIDRTSGFTLTEVLVSFVIIATALTVLLPIVGDNLRLGLGAQEAKAATQLAQSKLAQVGTLVPLRPGETAGAQDGLRWQVRIGPPIRVDSPDAVRLALFDIVASVGRDGPEEPALVTLQTQRIGVIP